jgi:hypothetical protein
MRSAWLASEAEASRSFLKKRTKKLFIRWLAVGGEIAGIFGRVRR